MNEAKRRAVKKMIATLERAMVGAVPVALPNIHEQLIQLLEPTKTFIIRLTLGDGSFTAVVVDDYTEREAIEQVKDTLSYNAIKVIGWKNESGGVTLKEDAKP